MSEKKSSEVGFIEANHMDGSTVTLAPGGMVIGRQDEVKAIVDGECIAQWTGQIIYNYGKAKIFNVLEAVMEPNERLSATKRVIADILADITKNVADELRDVLCDWQQEVIAGGEVSEEEAKQARKEYEEVEKIIR